MHVRQKISIDQIVGSLPDTIPEAPPGSIKAETSEKEWSWKLIGELDFREEALGRIRELLRHHQLLILAGGSGLGKPLKLIVHPLRSEIPIYIAAEGPKNVELATEIGDGWLPLFMSPYRTEMYADVLPRLRPGFEVACPVTVVVNDDLEQAMLPVRRSLRWSPVCRWRTASGSD